MFQVFNTIVRASPESREAVLQYFSRVVSLNVKRSGMQVDPNTVASDSFMINIQSILLGFAEPFMDATYSKVRELSSTPRHEIDKDIADAAVRHHSSTCRPCSVCDRPVPRLMFRSIVLDGPDLRLIGIRDIYPMA